MELLETIKCKNGMLENLKYHQARFDNAQIMNFRTTPKIKLENKIKIPDNAKYGLFKCRVIYSLKIEKIEFTIHRIKKISSLQLIECDNINYQHKSTDRATLTNLYEKRGKCDDILIVKNGFITDSFTANAIFFDGNKWLTPDTPLLPGTQRARLLYEGQISTCKITPYDLHKYQKIGLINAMQNMEDMPVVPIDKVLA